MKKLYLILMVFLYGCSNNPLASMDPYENAPVVVMRHAFRETTRSLNTSYKVEAWLQANAKYTNFAEGWSNAEEGSLSDNAKELAYNFWREVDKSRNSSKKAGGNCSSYTAFFVYCMRENGYVTGGSVTRDGRHIVGWVKEEDGTVSVLDVGWGYKQPLFYKAHSSYNRFIDTLGREHKEVTGLCDDRLVKLSDKNARAYGNLHKSMLVKR